MRRVPHGRFNTCTVPEHVQAAIRSRTRLGDGQHFAEFRYEPAYDCFALYELNTDRSQWIRARYIIDEDRIPRMPDERDIKECLERHGQAKHEADRWWQQERERKERQTERNKAQLREGLQDVADDNAAYKRRRGEDHVHDDWRMCNHGILLIDCSDCSRVEQATRAAGHNAGAPMPPRVTDRRRVTADGELREAANGAQ